MNKNKLLQLFIKDVEPPVNINGLLLYPQVGDDSIKWEIENPNNLSYSTDVIEGYIQELLYQFQITTGTKDLPEWKNCWTKYCTVTDSDVYINRELSNKMNQACNRLNTLKLEDDGKVMTADCYVTNWELEYPDSESLYVHISLELTNPKIDELGEIDNDTLSEFIQEFILNDTSGEQETDSVWEVMQPIMNDPNMYDKDYMFGVGVIKYYDSFGNNLLM